jgi:hypothetical protein
MRKELEPMEQAFFLLKNRNERWDEIIREYNERKFDELMAGFHQRYSPNRSLRLTSARNTSKYHPSQNMHLARKLMNHENTSFRDHNLQMGRGEELPLETIMTQEPLGGRFVFPAHTMGLTPTEGRQTIDVPESKRSYPVNLFGFEGTPERYGKNQDPEGIIYGNLEEDSVRRLNKNPFMLRDIQRAASMFLPRSKDAPPSRIGLEGWERHRARELAQMLMDAEIPGALIDPQTARAYGIESFQDIIPTKIGPDGKVISSITESLNDLTGNIGGGMDPLHGTFQQWERNMGPSGRVAELDETHTSPEQMQLLDDQLTAIPGAIMANPTQFYRSEPMDLAMRLLKAPVYDTDIPGIQFVTQGKGEDWTQDENLHGGLPGLWMKEGKTFSPSERAIPLDPSMADSSDINEIEQMTPNHFLEAAGKESMDDGEHYKTLMERAMAGEDMRFVMPRLSEFFPDSPPGHDGRHRMLALRNLGHGDTPVPVSVSEEHIPVQTGEPMDIAFQLLKERVSPEAKRHKLEYDKKYESSPERVKYREDLNRERRRRHIMGQGGPDMSHTSQHTIVPEDPHTNRARHFKDKGTLL